MPSKQSLSLFSVPTLTLLAAPFLGSLASGCSPNAAMAAQIAQTQSAQMPICQSRADQWLATTCSPTVKRAMASTADPRVADARAADAAALKQSCPRLSPTTVAQMDGCVSEMRTAATREQSAKEERLATERSRVAELRADPEFNTLIAEAREVGHAVTIAEDNALVAKKEKNPRVNEYNARLSRAREKESEVNAQIAVVMGRHGIDFRDGRDLGLW